MIGERERENTYMPNNEVNNMYQLRPKDEEKVT